MAQIYCDKIFDTYNKNNSKTSIVKAKKMKSHKQTKINGGDIQTILLKKYISFIKLSSMFILFSLLVCSCSFPLFCTLNFHCRLCILSLLLCTTLVEKILHRQAWCWRYQQFYLHRLLVHHDQLQ